jgi:hypothetical protein
MTDDPGECEADGTYENEGNEKECESEDSSRRRDAPVISLQTNACEYPTDGASNSNHK